MELAPYAYNSCIDAPGPLASAPSAAGNTVDNNVVVSTSVEPPESEPISQLDDATTTTETAAGRAIIAAARQAVAAAKEATEAAVAAVEAERTATVEAAAATAAATDTAKLLPVLPEDDHLIGRNEMKIAIERRVADFTKLVNPLFDRIKKLEDEVADSAASVNPLKNKIITLEDEISRLNLVVKKPGATKRN